MRPVFNFSALNVYLHVLRFRMLTTRQLTLILSKGDWVASLDLSDVYFHISIWPVSQKYLWFAYKGVVYEFYALPFGISTAPYVFTRMSCQLSKFLQPFSIPLYMYIDDWLTQALSAFLTALRLHLILLLARALGWIKQPSEIRTRPHSGYDLCGHSLPVGSVTDGPPLERGF